MVKANYSNFYMHSISTIKNVKKLYAKEYPELEKQKDKVDYDDNGFIDRSKAGGSTSINNEASNSKNQSLR